MREELRRLWRWTMHLERPNPLTPGLVLVVIVAVANAACMERGCYQRFELADLDPFLRASAPAARGTSLVLIDDEDYTNLFGGKSPLEPANVLKLVRAVCDFEPDLVGVDLLTSGWSAQNRRDAMSTLAGCPIVWVRDALLDGPGEVDAASAPARFILDGVIGNEGPPEVIDDDSPRVCAALPVLETDADGLVRGYRTHALARIRGNSHSQPYASFVWAMASPDPSAPRCGFEGGVGSSSIDTQKKIRFFDGASLLRLPATQVVNAAEHQKGELFANIKKQVLKRGSRVVVGGAFRHARDRYATPIGLLDGAELLAHAIETEGQEVRDVKWHYSLLADIGLGSVLLWGLNRLRLRLLWETMLSTVLAGFAALFVCWALFEYYGYFLGVFGSFAGIILGAAVGAAWEPAWKEAGEFWRRLQQVFARTPDEPPAAG